MAYLTVYLGVTGVGPETVTLPPHDRRAGAFSYDRPFGGTHFAENSVFGRGTLLGCNAAMADGSVRFLPVPAGDGPSAGHRRPPSL